jgi:hypothetical protein
VAQALLPVLRLAHLARVHSPFGFAQGRQEWLCHDLGHLRVAAPWSYMKLSRHQVIGSVLLALIVLAVLLSRAWPLLFPK